MNGADAGVYAQLVERLVLCGEFERAVQLANAHLPQGAGMYLLIVMYAICLCNVATWNRFQWEIS